MRCQDTSRRHKKATEALAYAPRLDTLQRLAVPETILCDDIQGHGRQRRLPFDLNAAFNQSLQEFLGVHRAPGLAENLIRGLGHALAGILTPPQQDLS